MPDLSLSRDEVRGAGVLSEAFVADDGTPIGYLNWTPRQPGRSCCCFHCCRWWRSGCSARAG
jgi:hypothetical protein